MSRAIDMLMQVWEEWEKTMGDPYRVPTHQDTRERLKVAVSSRWDDGQISLRWSKGSGGIEVMFDHNEEWHTLSKDDVSDLVDVLQLALSEIV